MQELLRKEDSKWCSDIDKDLDRTFPEHEQFCVDELLQKKGDGSAVTTKHCVVSFLKIFIFSMQLLRDVLKAYSIYNEAVGYCQVSVPL